MEKNKTQSDGIPPRTPREEADIFYLKALSGTLKSKKQPTNQDVEKFQIKVNEFRKYWEGDSDRSLHQWNPVDGMMKLDGTGATWNAIRWFDDWVKEDDDNRQFEAMRQEAEKFNSLKWNERPGRKVKKFW